MVIFINDDRPYLSWLARHRSGFVLAATRRRSRRPAVLHRATCAEIKVPKSKRTHWTRGRQLKACSLEMDELVVWAREETGRQPTSCQVCAPDREPLSVPEDVAGDARPAAPLTKLGNEILSYVLEVAVIQLDDEDSEYRLTVADVALYLRKSPAQLSAALLRLVEDGYISTVGTVTAGQVVQDTRVYPTSTALRTIPAFAEMPVAELARELDRLRDRESA